jgi:hypothetical protein
MSKEIRLTKDRLFECAKAAALILKLLERRDLTMRYQEFAVAVGLIAADQRWEPWHRKQITRIIFTAEAVDNYGGAPEIPDSAYYRVVGSDKMPGPGVRRIARIQELEPYTGSTYTITERLTKRQRGIGRRELEKRGTPHPLYERGEGLRVPLEVAQAMGLT